MTSESLIADRMELRDFMNTVAQAPSSALLLDYDGTLAPFSSDRQNALPYPGEAPILHENMLSGRTRVVVVSGRNAYEVLFLLRIDPLPEVWGSHGLQRLLPDGSCHMPHVDTAVSEGLAEAGRWLAEQGLQRSTEFKPGAVALHWRGTRNSRALDLRDDVVRAWTLIAHRANLSLLDFDGGIEIRMPDLDKGDAVRTILQEMRPDIPVAYLGDDTTDERAFRALGDHGLSILVRPEWRRTCAQLWLKPPGEVLDFLVQWRTACSASKADNGRYRDE